MMKEVAILILAFMAMTCPREAEADELIDDFESPSSIDDWSFTNGPEFPGASGDFNVAAGEGAGGSAAGVLSFDFTGGGNYVAAARQLDAPTACDGISFLLKGYVPGMHGVVRLVDETGQTHQVRFPMRNYGGEFKQYRILTGGDDAFWGGANDGIFHGGLTALAILVDKGMNYHKTGSISFDNVMTAEGRDAQIDLPRMVVYTYSLQSDPMDYFQGVNIHFAVPDETQLDLAAEAGFKLVRMDLIWNRVEQSPGVYEFSPYDQLIDALEARNMRALLIIDYANELYYDGPGEFTDTWGPQTQETRDAYAAFAAAAAARYAGRDVELELWNEPNIDAFWKPAPNAHDYNLMAAQALAAIKAAAPTKVVLGGTSGIDVSFTDEVLSYGGLEGIDRVSIHPYRGDLPPETFFEEAAAISDIVEARTGRSDVPVISGEWGYSTTWFGGSTPEALAKQERWAIREILFNLSRHVQRLVWYDLTCDGADPAEREHNFGLLDHGTLAPRPAYRAIRAFHELTADMDTVSVVDIPHGNLHGLAFDHFPSFLLVLWNDRPGCDVDILFPAHYEFFDMEGSTLTGVTFESGMAKFSLSESMGPVYVRIPGCDIYPCDAATDEEQPVEPRLDAVTDLPFPEDAAYEAGPDEPTDAPADAADGVEETGGGCGCSLAVQ
jgi:hypothetical protein